MNGLGLVVLALVAAASVHALPKSDSVDMAMQQLMANVKNQVPQDKIEEASAVFEKLKSTVSSMELDLDDLFGDQEIEVGDIGPDFSSKQFFKSIKRVGKSSWQKRCKKISGEENGYDMVHNASEEFSTCFRNWQGVDEIMMSYNHTLETGEYKSTFKAVCSGRSGFFACTDKYIDTISRCHFPSQMDYVRKVDRINKNLLHLVCSNEEDNFALFDAEGDGLKCVQQSMNEIKTCANKAVFAVTERFLAKFIENEHFSFAMETEDCTVYDEVKSCFVSSVANCTNPKVKNAFSSVFQIIRDETKC